MPLKTQFHDAHERRAYLRTLEIARRILADPKLLKRGRDYLDRFVRDDPHQRRVYELWIDALRQKPERLVLELVADTERGAHLRETAPVFSVIEADLARRIGRRPE